MHGFQITYNRKRKLRLLYVVQKRAMCASGANRTKRVVLARVDYFSSGNERKVLSWEWDFDKPQVINLCRARIFHRPFDGLRAHTTQHTSSISTLSWSFHVLYPEAARTVLNESALFECVCLAPKLLPTCQRAYTNKHKTSWESAPSSLMP